MKDLTPTPGPQLAARRRVAGIDQEALAARLGIHRVTLSGWERSASVDVVRTARYERALLDLVGEAVQEVSA